MYIYNHVHAHTHRPVILCVMCMIVYIVHVPTVPMPNGMDTPGGLRSEWFKANFEASYLIVRTAGFWCRFFLKAKGYPLVN